jgi:predicted nuclease of predicted toxin-antitoxin system
MQRAADEEILAFAANRGYVMITLDADFHTLIAVRGQHPVDHRAAP